MFYFRGEIEMNITVDIPKYAVPQTAKVSFLKIKKEEKDKIRIRCFTGFCCRCSRSYWSSD